MIEALERSGLIPTGATLAQAQTADWLPVVIRAWLDCGNTEVATCLQQSAARGASLTQLPSLGSSRDSRLAWWPRGEPRQRRVAIVTSRLGQELDRRRSWFMALRATCMSLSPGEDILTVAESTAASEIVQRASRLFGLPVLRVECSDGKVSLEEWGKRVLQICKNQPPGEPSVSISPPLRATGQARAPVADRASMTLSDRVLALHVRPGGYQERLLRERLGDAHYPPASVYLAVGSELVSKDVADPLMAKGAVGWLLLNTLSSANPTALPWQKDTIVRSRPAPLPDASDWQFLTHCTRRRAGPWPGEDRDTYWDDLILDREGADHSAMASLWRIVHTGRLLASSEMVRGDSPMVCFTQTALQELPRLRRYQSHLGRWDFEPYGLCIRRNWLEQAGARPVLYGDDATWAELGEDDRPFFQQAVSVTRSGKRLHWTDEREWRIVGDLDLNRVPDDAALLFVPTDREARHLAAFSRWPVTVLAEAQAG